MKKTAIIILEGTKENGKVICSFSKKVKILQIIGLELCFETLENAENFMERITNANDIEINLLSSIDNKVFINTNNDVLHDTENIAKKYNLLSIRRFTMKKHFASAIYQEIKKQKPFYENLKACAY